MVSEGRLFRSAPTAEAHPGTLGGGALAERACLPPAGHFSPRKSAENAPGAAAPGPPLGRAACIPGRGIAQAVTLHRAVPFHTTRPFPASRGPVESGNRYGYYGFHKGRMDCPGTGVEMAHGSFLHILSMFAVGARIARPCRAAASRGGRGGCARPFVPPHQRPPCVKGPQGSAACGRTSDRSGWAAACLGGPQRGPGRLSGNPGLSAARLTGGLSTPPTRLRRATSPYTGEAFSAAFDGNPQAPAPKRTRDARPYGGDGWPGGNVGADAFIDPCRAAASRGGRGGCARPFVRPHQRPPCVKGAVSRQADWGIVNPSGTAPPCHLPLHRGGFFRRVRWKPSGTGTKADARCAPLRRGRVAWWKCRGRCLHRPVPL